ncbi:MAG: GspH/FimT family pseudopilin [Gemmatimonadetes bacterium]|nr:GspH/FimT family pseudopilin [Gemmatimonadota bacterium]
MRISSPRHPGNAGYSLVELLAVMTVMTLLMAIVIPVASPMLERTRVNGAANVLASDLQNAQALAVQHRTPIRISMPAPMEYQIFERNNPGTIYRTRTLGPNSEFRLDELTATSSTIDLFPNGVARATVTFTLGLNGYQRRVRLTRAGQIRILRGL